MCDPSGQSMSPAQMQGGRYGGYRPQPSGMMGPRMMMNRPMQVPTQAPGMQFSAGGGDRSPQYNYDEAARRVDSNGMAGQGNPQQSPAGGADLMSQMFSNIGGYGMQSPQISQAPAMQTGGGSPFEAPQITQNPNMGTGGGSPYQPDPPQGNNGGMGALRGFGPNGAGGYIDPFAGWTTGPETRTPPSHPAPPMAPQQTPGWAQGNPTLYRMLYGGAAPNAQQTIDARGQFFNAWR